MIDYATVTVYRGCLETTQLRHVTPVLRAVLPASLPLSAPPATLGCLFELTTSATQLVCLGFTVTPRPPDVSPVPTTAGPATLLEAASRAILLLTTDSGKTSLEDASQCLDTTIPMLRCAYPAHRAVISVSIVLTAPFV